MSDPFGERPFPRGALVGAAMMVGLTITLVLIYRVTGADTSQMPPLKVAAARDLRFLDSPGGAVSVIDAHSNAPVAVLPPGSNGFVRATLRSFARDRRSRGVGDAAPFHLAASEEGRLTLADPVTGRHIELEAFGHTNAGIFAAFLSPSRVSP